MRVNRREPQDQDEQREFHEILEQFKRGIDQNLDSDDYEAHYDLGVAFKEMGLLDEAIGEFQKALRSPEGRLRTSEALGMAFFEKGQYAACESVLTRGRSRACRAAMKPRSACSTGWAARRRHWARRPTPSRATSGRWWWISASWI